MVVLPYPTYNILSNVAIPQVIHMPCVNIHRSKELSVGNGFCACLLTFITMDNTLHRSDSIQLFLQQSKEVYIANSCLISNACTVISTWQNFCVKIFLWGTLKIYLHEYLTHEYFHTWKFPDLWQLQLYCIVVQAYNQ